MFGIGTTELVLLAVAALLLFGPSKLPDLGRSIGKALGEFKRATDGIQSAVKVDMNKIIEEDRGAAPEPEASQPGEEKPAPEPEPGNGPGPDHGYPPGN